MFLRSKDAIGSRHSPPRHEYFSDTDDREVRNWRRSVLRTSSSCPNIRFEDRLLPPSVPTQPISLVDVGYDVEQAFKVFMGLVTAAAMALALDALVRDTMGISNHSFVVRSLGSAGYLAVV